MIVCSINFGPAGGFPSAWSSPEGDFISELGAPDSHLYPDWSTLCRVPFASKPSARVLCAPYYTNKQKQRVPLPQCREICKALLRKLEDKHGLKLFSAFEFEFLHLNKDQTPKWGGTNIFSGLQNAKIEDFSYKCEKYLKEMGVDMNTQNVEFAPGQHEWTMMPEFGIKGADTAYTYKNGIKEIGYREGDLISFMTRPFPDGEGCSSGGHYNHSLWHVNGESAFYDASKPNGVSDIMKHWTAGLLTHAKALVAFSAPTVNCYLRFGPYSWSPWNATYGFENRMCLCRWKAPGTPGGTYMEFRLPSAATNPYLTIAAIVAAGMDGLEKGAANDKFMEEAFAGGSKSDAYAFDNAKLDLPRCLSEAIAELKADDVVRSAIGDQFIEWFEETKKLELDTLEVKPSESENGKPGQKDAELARKTYLEFI